MLRLWLVCSNDTNLSIIVTTQRSREHDWIEYFLWMEYRYSFTTLARIFLSRSICLVGLCNLLQCECIGLAVIDSCRGNMQCAIIWTLIYFIAYRREMKFVRYFVQCSERWDVLDYLENKICKVSREIILLLLFSETCYLKIICISLKNEVRDRTSEIWLFVRNFILWCVPDYLKN